MGRAIPAVVSGIVVGILTGVVAWSFLMAATWSSIHGGMSQVMLAVLSLLAMVAPLACGFLVGWAIYRWQPRPGGMQRRDSIPPDLILQKCPDCGCSMNLAAEYSATSPYTVVECPIHGPYHFGPDTSLTLGRPRQL